LACGVIFVILLCVQVVRESEEKKILLYYQRLGQNRGIQNLPKDNSDINELNNAEVKNNNDNTTASEKEPSTVCSIKF
jgi:phosphoribosylamine-glycine ligase